MKPSKSTTCRGKRLGHPQSGYRVWHFALAVPAIAVTLQLFLGSLSPLPKQHDPYQTRYVASAIEEDASPYADDLRRELYPRQLPKVEVLPLNLQGEMTSPLLASVIKEYFPQSTHEQAADFRDTLPPGEDPRMIVIVPKDDEPVF